VNRHSSSSLPIAHDRVMRSLPSASPFTPGH
jgi:hypothetical protein